LREYPFGSLLNLVGFLLIPLLGLIPAVHLLLGYSGIPIEGSQHTALGQLLLSAIGLGKPHVEFLSVTHSVYMLAATFLTSLIVTWPLILRRFAVTAAAGSFLVAAPIALCLFAPSAHECGFEGIFFYIIPVY